MTIAWLEQANCNDHSRFSQLVSAVELLDAQAKAQKFGRAECNPFICNAVAVRAKGDVANGIEKKVRA